MPVCCPATQYIASAPTRETTDPMNRYRVSFIAAYSRVFTQPQIDDQQVHREDGDFVEEEQHEQVQRDENAEHAGRQDEQEGKELARAVIDAPGDQHPGEHDDAGQQDQRRAHPVHTHVVGDAQRGSQWILARRTGSRHGLDQVLGNRPRAKGAAQRQPLPAP